MAMNPAAIGALVGAGIMGLGFLVALARRGRAATARLGGRKLEVRSSLAADDAFARIAELGGRYTVDDRDASRRVLVLSSSPTLTTWGFLYPVFVHADGRGARVEVGISSRFVQLGPLVGVAHRKCVAAIEEALAVPAARVAS